MRSQRLEISAGGQIRDEGSHIGGSARRFSPPPDARAHNLFRRSRGKPPGTPASSLPDTGRRPCAPDDGAGRCQRGACPTGNVCPSESTRISHNVPAACDPLQSSRTAIRAVRALFPSFISTSSLRARALTYITPVRLLPGAPGGRAPVRPRERDCGSGLRLAIITLFRLRRSVRAKVVWR